MIINLSPTLKKMLKYSTIFFAKQLFLINTNSGLPSQFSKKTHKLLSTFHFTSDDILKIIKNPEKNKTHDHDLISIRIIKICDPSIENTLQINLSIMFWQWKIEWKKANVVPAHKNGDKQNLKNYNPISLLPIAGKLFERTLCNNYVRIVYRN